MYTRRQKIGFFLGPCIFMLCLVIPRPGGMSPESFKTAAVALLMSVWWITEAIPIPATSLLPIALFPPLGIMESADVTPPYANHLIYLFLGGFFIAITMEKWNLHKRIALNIIRIVGTNPNRIVLGFMVASAVLSMWISNLATTMMMVPIALAVISQAGDLIEKQKIPNIDTTPTHFVLGINLMIGIAFASSVGGVSTIIGTPPNTILVGLVESMYNQEISFGTWFALAFPLSLIMLFITWLYLVKFLFPMKLKELPGGRSWIRDELHRLGPITRPERYTLYVFSVVALAWILRGFINIEALRMVKDPTIAMIGGIALFLIPVDFRRGEFLLDWQSALKVPWGVIILYGGGLSLANAMQISGLAEWIGKQVMILQGSSILVVVLIVVFLSIFLTNLTSNTATATMLIPIMGVSAIAMSIHPFLLIVAAGISVSYAFLLPTATPPNAIVFGSGYITIPQMVKAGLGLSIIGGILITIFVRIFLPVIWGIDPGSLPDWVTMPK
ncbi:MAG: SLC13/DASS family transporter [Candidatus Latescibacteria bacterium]|nr:SLC13/DASS family transporter [Candidatus Latescibacterota bacterium]